jgi:hypothetical protein
VTRFAAARADRAGVAAIVGALATAGVLGAAAPAGAAPTLPLTLSHAPPPHHLRMRPRAATKPPAALASAAAPGATTAPAPSSGSSAGSPGGPPSASGGRRTGPIPAAPAPLSPSDPTDRSDQLAGLRDLREPVSFSMTVGYQVDGARPSGKASFDAPVQEGRDYSALRSYGFGELFLSTRGVVADSLASYFSLRFDAANPETFHTADQGDVRVAPPIATWFERDTFEVRTGWAELKDFLPRRLGLKKLRLRAGNQYIYGPWVMHIDGALLAYDGDVVSATTYAGGRHPDYTTDLTNVGYAVAGASLRINLRELAALPITITGETLTVASSAAGQPDTAHRQLEVDWQPRRDLTVLGQLRTLDDKLANERIQLRARYHEVSNLAFEVIRRFDTDWEWDPTLVANDDPTAPRRYLDLGPVLPQVVASLRGGTLIAENVDLVARTTVAADQTPDGTPKSSFSAAYVEVGGAVEVRLRREVAVGASVLNRQTMRQDIEPITDVRLVAQPLPPSAATGETSFTELGARARLSLGARRFSTTVELYGRSTHYAKVYVDPTNPIPTSDVRGGGRVSVDAWINQRLRLTASYDLSSALELEPEITAYKSVRLTMTGMY